MEVRVKLSLGRRVGLLVLLMNFPFTYGQITGREIMEHVLARPVPTTSISRIELTLIRYKRGKEKRRVRELIRHQKHYASGEFTSKTLLRFVRPKVVKGTGFLTWSYRDGHSEQWLFLPRLKMAKRIESKERSANFLGTEFTYEDLGNLSLEAEEYEVLDPDTVFGVACYRVLVQPIEQHYYQYRMLWIDQENWLVKKAEFYDHNSRLLKVLTIPEHIKEGPYWRVTTMTMENVQTNRKTILKVSDVEYDVGIQDNFFTQRFLIRID